MEDFATYMLKEKDYIQKMIITYYLSKKTGIFFNKSIVLRAELARLFINYNMIDVDEDLLVTAILLCNCKKVDNAQDVRKLETYAKEGAEYLSTLGFGKRFCKICEEVNRYSESQPREKESDVLEIVDQFAGLILNRIERPAFSIEEALVILKERNFKDINNRYLEDFILFIKDMEKICVKETIDVPIITKLISLHNHEANVKSFISVLGNTYSKKFEDLINEYVENKAGEMLSQNGEENLLVKRKRYTRVQHNANRALFSKEISDRILNHESVYRIEE